MKVTALRLTVEWIAWLQSVTAYTGQAIKSLRPEIWDSPIVIKVGVHNIEARQRVATPRHEFGVLRRFRYDDPHTRFEVKTSKPCNRIFWKFVTRMESDTKTTFFRFLESTVSLFRSQTTRYTGNRFLQHPRHRKKGKGRLCMTSIYG